MNIFKCSCGHYGYLEIDKEDDGVWFSFIEEPKGLWQRIKCFFRSKRYISEICLSDKDIKKLIKSLS